MNSQKLQFSQNYTYKIKILILGDKNVGKTTMIYTYVNEQVSKTNLLKEDLNFFIKKQVYELGDKQYECRMHLWDASGVLSIKQSQTKFMRQHLYQGTRAYILVFDDEESFAKIVEHIWKTLVKIKPTSKQEIYLIYNKYKQDGKSKQLQGHAQKFAKTVKIDYRIVNAKEINSVLEFYKSLVDRIMFKVSDGIIPLDKIIISDRQNKVLLKDVGHRRKEYFEKRYNMCC